MKIDPDAMNDLEKAIDAKVSKASREKSSQVLAEVTRVDPDGTTWVHVFGGSDETPVRLMSSEAKPGDVITITLTGLSALGIGNMSSPAATASMLNDRATSIEKVVEALRGQQVEFESVTTDELTAQHAYIRNLESDTAKIHDLTADQISASVAYVDDLTAENVTTTDLAAAHAYIAALEADNISASDLSADHAVIGDLDANYAQIGLANVDTAYIDHGVIRTAAIVDEQVFTVSGNKATLAKLDASKINVYNLKADNLIVSKINGQPVLGNYEAVNENQSGYTSKNPSQEGWYEFASGGFVLSADTTVDTEKAYFTKGAGTKLYDQSYIDGLAEDLNQRIDGAIETWTGTAVPTMVTYPVSDWSQAEYPNHVGDIYYVINAVSDEDGFCYRFAFDQTSQTYGWVLIKDSDVTKALQDITDLQDFESTTTSWIEETDQGLTTIRQNHTALSGVVKANDPNLLLDWNASSTSAVDAPTTRYWSDAGNTMITCSFFAVADPPKNGISYGARFVCNGTNTSAAARGLRFYNGANNYIPLVTGTTYTATWWARCTSGSGKARFGYSNGTSVIYSDAEALTASWKQFTYTFSTTVGDYGRVYYSAYFGANTAGTVEICGFRLVIGASAESVNETFVNFEQNTFKELVDEVDEQSSTITSMSTRVDSIAKPNLTPWFSMPKDNVYDAETNPSGYWKRIANNSQFTTYDMCVDHNGSGGWAHFAGNVTGSNPYVRFEPMPISLKPSTEYTFMLELDGTFASTFTNINWRMCDGSETDAYDLFATRANIASPDGLTSGTYYVKATTNANMSDALTLGRAYVQLYGTGAFDVYARISLYEGDYDGPYKPYVPMAELVETKNVVNQVKQTADTNTASISGISTIVSNNGLTSSTNITSRASKIEQTLDGFSSTVGAIVDESVTGTNILTGNALNPYNWTISAPTGASYTKAAYGTAGVKVTFNAISGWEWLYSPAITVVSGKSYTLSVEYTVGKDYAIASGKGGYGLSVYKTTPPHSSYDNANANFVAKAQFFETQTRVAMRAAVTFTASSTTVYLGLNGGQIADGPTGLEFTLDKLKLVENISSRMTSAESQITQNKDAISLNAKKAEVASNMLYDTDVNGWTKVNGPAARYLSDSGNTNITATFVELADPPEEGITYAVAVSANGSQTSAQSRSVCFYSGNGPRLGVGQAYVLSCWARCTSGTGAWVHQVGTSPYWNSAGSTAQAATDNILDSKWRYVTTRFTYETATMGGTDSARIYFGTAFKANTAGTVQLCGFKLEPQLYASQAELKVANDAISARVEKNGVIASINASVETEGGSAVKISADKVNIEGAAIFSNYSTTNQMNSAISSAVDNLEIGGRNLLIGTGSAKTSNAFTLNSSNYTTYDYYTLYKPYNQIVEVGDLVTVSFDWSTTATGDYFRIECGTSTPYSWGTVINAIGTRSATSNVIDVTSSRTSGYVAVTFQANSTHVSAADTLNKLRIRVDGTSWSGKTLTLSNAKAERGNKATDWTPAPEDQTAYVDSSVAQSTKQNLALTTGAVIKPTSYDALDIYLSEPLESGQQYTFKMWDVDISNSGATSNNLRLSLYYCGGYVQMGYWDYTYFTNGHADELDMTFTPYDNAVATTTRGTGGSNLQHSSVTGAARKYFRLYNIPSGTYTRNLTVGRWKLVKGDSIQNWSAAPEDYASASDAIEYIAGTQTAATNLWTGVTKDSALNAGKTISYYLPYAGNSSAATLNLTFAGGGTSGAKNVRFNSNNSANNNVTTHYGAGSIIQMTYDGTYWRVAASYYDTGGISNARYRTQWANAITAVSGVTAGITAAHIICGTSSGYRDIGGGVAFDLSYPLLYATAAIAEAATGTGNYLTYNGINASTSGTITSGGANKTLFLKGTVSGNTFTISSSGFLTCAPATAATDPVQFYIPLGVMYSTTNIYFNSSKDLYAYVDGKFRQVNPTDIVATQKIYYRSSSSSKPSGNGLPTAWVTETGNKWAANATTAANWSTKPTPLANGTGASATKYPYLWTCEQRKRLDGTVDYTSILLDDTDTVIDGGNIITGTVTANQLNATSINASGVLTIGSLSSDTQSQLGGSGFTIIWDSNAGTSSAGGEAKLCLRDPLTGTITAGSAGWVMWNGVKRTVPNSDFNPNANLPYNIPIYLVLRLSSATSTTGTMYAVFYQSGWKQASAMSSPTTTYTDWTWVEATDLVLGKCVEPGSEAVFTECETYEQPRSYKSVTNTNVTSGSANAAAAAAQSTANTANTTANTANGRAVAYRGTCGTAAGTAAKAVTCANYALANGATIECYCSTANTANVPTLNVNSTGAKPIWINGAVASASNPCKWKAGDTVTFTYETTNEVYRASLPVENYITADSSGIKIHDATNTTYYQHQTSSGTDIYVAGKKRTSVTSTGLEVFDTDGTTSLAKFGGTARVGKEASGYIFLSDDGLKIYRGIYNIAHIGYGQSAGESGTEEAPYFSFGLNGTYTPGAYSTSEGVDAKATAFAAHAEGVQTEASGNVSHAEGLYNEVSGSHSHVGGSFSTVTGSESFAHGFYLIADDDNQAVFGKYNKTDSSSYSLVVGNGTADNSRSNALTLDNSGNLKIAGAITLGTALTASQIPNLAASKINSGTLALARGGTGANGSSTAINTVFAGPSSGSAGNASFRALVAADIPGLAASKITSGTLGVARGGTNKTSGEFFGATRIYSSTATCTTFTLTSSAANYSWLTILYKGNDGFFDSVTVFNNKAAINVALAVIESTANGTVNIKRVTYQISGTSATVKTYGEADMSGSSVTCGSTAHVTITGVWGWV